MSVLINEQFFELGGTSLLATRFVNRVENDLNEHLPVVSLFEAPTIETYSAYLRQNFARAVTRIFSEATSRTSADENDRNELRAKRSLFVDLRRCRTLKFRKTRSIG